MEDENNNYSEVRDLSNVTPVESEGKEDMYSDLPPMKPHSWLWVAIVATLFFCNVLGIVGVVYASRVDAYFYSGRYDESRRSAQKAKIWTIVALVVGVLLLTMFWRNFGIALNSIDYIMSKGASGYNY